MSTSIMEFDAREVLERTIQAADLRDDRELLQVCRLFRFPNPLRQDAGDEQVGMPGAYPFLRMPEAPGSKIPSGRVNVNRDCRSILQRVLGSLFSSKPLENPPGVEKFPSEVLKKIFVFAHVQEFLLNGPLTLINVSKQWRATALSVPTLWEKLDIAYGNSTNPFYTITYHIFHAREFQLFVNSPVVFAALASLNAVIPPSIRPKVQLVQLSSLALLGFGAIEVLNSFSFHYPNLTRLMLMDVRHLFPTNLLANCPTLEILVIDFSVEVVSGRFLNEELPYCTIICTLLDITWSGKWAQFNTTYGNNLSIFQLKSFTYSLVDPNGFFKMPPLSLLANNLDIENLVLRGVSLADMDFEIIATSTNPGSYPPLTNLWKLTRLELSEVDQSTTLFRLCIEFPASYFPRLAWLYLTCLTLDIDVLMTFIRMRIKGSGSTSPYVSPLRNLSLKGIPLDEKQLAELASVNISGGSIVEISP